MAPAHTYRFVQWVSGRGVRLMNTTRGGGSGARCAPVVSGTNSRPSVVVVVVVDGRWKKLFTMVNGVVRPSGARKQVPRNRVRVIWRAAEDLISFRSRSSTLSFLRDGNILRILFLSWTCTKHILQAYTYTHTHKYIISSLDKYACLVVIYIYTENAWMMKLGCITVLGIYYVGTLLRGVGRRNRKFINTIRPYL